MPALAAVAKALKFVPIVEVAKIKGCVLVMLALVPLVSATVPLRLLAAPWVVKSIALPAFSVVVPGTVSAPLWLMMPPAVTFRLPLLFKVRAGKAIFALALLKFSVKLRRLVSALRLVGMLAAAAILVRLKSCTALKVAPLLNVIALFRLFAWSRMMSAPAVFSVRVKRPVAAAACVSAPTCVKLPLAVRFKSPVPTEEVPSVSAPLLTSDTVLLPVLLKETAPLK